MAATKRKPEAPRTGFKYWLVGLLGSTFLRLMRWSWRIDGRPGPDYRTQPAGVHVCWHSQFLLTAVTQGPFGANVIVSQHGDGEYVARALERYGTRCIRGSSSRGGARALIEIVRRLKDGQYVCFQADGPRGPRMRLKPGPVLAAMRSGKPIICHAFGWSRAKRLRSWDRSVIPPPFAKVTVLWSEPIEVPRRLDEAGIEEYRLRVEERLTELAHEAAALFGLPREIADVDPLGLDVEPPAPDAGITGEQEDKS